jgi:hypothetical protein
MNPGSENTKTYSFKNSGNVSWAQAQTTLRIISGSAAGLRTVGWQNDIIVATLNEASVAPGDTGTFTVNYLAPLKKASYNFTLSPYVNTTNIGLSSTKVSVSVSSPDYTAKFQTQSAFPTIAQGGHSNAFFSAKNSGNVAWYDDTSLSSAPAGTKPVHLATTNPINRSSVFSGGAWGSGNNRPAVTFSAVYEADGTTLATNQHVVQPGQIAKFSFTFSVPSNKAAGTYREYFQPIVEGYNPWSMGLVGWIDVKVTD